MNYAECVDYLYQIPRFTKKAPLAQTEDFLHRLGVDLSMRMPKIIHVAGTNGKGSVCAYLDRILRADGYHTGLFTSPHLVEPRERIRIDGEMVSEETFVRCFERVYPVAKAMERDGAGHPAFFSFVLGMAMVAFGGDILTERNKISDVNPDEDTVCGNKDPRSGTRVSEKEYEGKRPLDYIVLETGMGGLLDNTNVFRNPALTVITRIGLDHTQYLGDTRSAIAVQKAGILKPGVPVVYLEDPEAAPVIEKRAEELACPRRKVDAGTLRILEKDREGILFRYSEENDTGKNTAGDTEKKSTGDAVKKFNGNAPDDIKTAVKENQKGREETRKSKIFEEYRIAFAANYQVENAALAICAAKELGCSEEAIRAGLQHARWPGRMQEVGDGFYVDGAHNVDGMRALLSGLDDLAGKWAGRRILLFGAVQDKDYGEMYRELTDGYHPDLVVLTGLETSRGVPVEELVEVTGQLKKKRSADIPEKIIFENTFGKEKDDPVTGPGLKITEGSDEKENSVAGPGLKITEIPDEKENLKAFRTVREALNFARSEKAPEDFLLCAGSLYLVGEVLGILWSQ